MKTVFRLLFVIVASMPVLAQAQSGIGLPPFDADVAFHIKTGSFDHGLRVDGLVDDPTDLLTDVIVKDATGVLYYRPITDLTVSGEWIDHPSLPYIFANQADAAGNRVVVTDAGNLGIGTVAPRNSIEVNTGIIIGTGVQGAYSTAEDIRLAGGATSDAIITTQDGTGRWAFKWNATNGAGETFLTTGDHATKMLINGDPALGGDAFAISHSTAAGTAGASISWNTPFTIENDGNVGIGTTNPAYQLHAVGDILLDGDLRFDYTDIPVGVINGVPATDPQILMLDNADIVQRISYSDLFDFEGEWQDHTSGNYVYARRAFDDNTQNVVITDLGNVGIGLTNPDEKFEISNGGMRINGWNDAISFRETTDSNDDPTGDGARIYLQNNAFAGWQDALIFEKTDFNNNAVDGGMAFANRQAGNNRTFTMVIRGDGDIGIGPNNTNPTERLHVFGNGLFQSDAIGNSANAGLVKIVDDVELSGNLRRGVQVAEQNGGAREDYGYFGLEDIATGNDALISWGDRTNRDFHISHNNDGTRRDVMTFDGEYLNVGIGTLPTPSTDIKLHVGGQVRVDDLDPQGSFDISSDLIVIADSNGDLKTVTSSVFQQDFEDLDWTIEDYGTANPADDDIYNANGGQVGIGITNPTAQLHVNGNLRMENSSAIELDDADVRLFAPNDGELDIEAHTTTTFQHRGAGIDPLVVNHQTGQLAIGIGRAGNALSATVDGVLRMQDDSELQFGTDPDNMLYAQSATDFRLTAQSLFSVRARNDAIGVLTVQTGNGGANRQVGILTNSPQDALDVNGRLRVRDVPVENGFDQFLVVDPANGQVRRRELANFEGPWDRSAAGDGRTFLRTVTDHVGIGTSAPEFPLHIVEPVGSPHASNNGTLVLDHEDNGGQSSIVFRSSVNRGSDYGYINYFDDNPDLTTGSSEQSLLEIGTQNDNSNLNRDDVAIMPSSNLGVKTRTPSRALDVNGNLRVRTLADTPTDIYALTADANGNVNRQDISAIKDNLGDHDMDVPLATNGFTIKYDDDHTTTADDNNGGMRLTPQNSLMVSNRFQMGNLSPNWIDDNITSLPPEVSSGSVTNGFAGNDGAIFAPVRTVAERSDLRLYILDNPDDQFSIWGNPCPSADCGAINNSNRVASFRADGGITFDGLATGGGPDQMVLADANGRLFLGGAPGSGSSSGGDNLGNHTATENINLGPHQIRTQAGLTIEGNTGNINFPNTRGLFWGSIYRTAITGDVEANGEGGLSDLRFESGDDMFFQSRGGNGDFLIRTADYVARATNYMRFHVGTDATNDDFRFYTDSNDSNVDNPNHNATNGSVERLRIQNDGEIQVFDLAGAGSALVGVNAAGELERVSTSSDGLWERDAANSETFLRNTGDDVGIGTADPTQKLDVVGTTLFRNGNTQTGYANNQILLSYDGGTGYSHAIKSRHNGSGENRNAIDFFLWHRGVDAIGDVGTKQILTLDGNSGGRVGIGVSEPAEDLHIQQQDGSGLIDPSTILLQNTTSQGSSALSFMEGTGGLGNNNGMSLRYHSSADGSTDGFEILRGAATNTNTAHVHVRVERNNGQVTINNLATGAADEMVIADANGVLSTQAFPDAIWDKDDTDSEIFLDAAVNAYRVGIGTNAPVRKLHVNGDVRIESIGSGVASDNVLTVDANGDVRSLPMSDFENYWTRDGGTGALYPATSADNVGIGESNPSAKLHVDGDAIVTSMTNGAVGTDEIVVVDANGLLKKIPGNSYDAFWDRNTSGAQDYIQLSTATDFVGIGTTGTPQAQLHTTGSVRFESLANLNDEVVIADAAGNLSTRTLPAELWNRDIANGYTYTAFGADEVGIGTSTPSSRLHVANGQVTITDIVSNTGDILTDRVVVANSSGELRSLAVGDLYTPWDRNGTDVFLRNQDDFVGIGTGNPISVLHVEDQLPNTGDPMEMRFQNRAGNGVVQMRFRTGTNSGGFTDENNSMTLRYSNQFDALEITNGYVNGDANFASHFKVRRANGFVGINVGTANPSDMLEVGQGNIRISDGNLEVGDGHRIQFDEANSYLGDQSNTAGGDDDVMLRATDILYLRGGDNQGIRINGNGTIRFDDVPNGNNAMDLLVANGAGDLRRINASTYASNFGWTRSGSDVTLFDNADNVGIGVISSGSRLDVNGTTRIRGAMTIDNLGGAGNQMVVADNTGVLSIQALPTDTDDQGLTWTPGTSTLSIEDGNSVDLSALLDNTDAQAISVTSDVLSITGNASTVDLSPYLDNTDAQAISLISNTLSISGNASTVDLSGYVNTDAQDLSLSGNILSLTNDGTTVDLSGYVNTDAQAMSYDGATGIITLVNGGTVNLATSSIIDDQDLELTGSILSLTNDASPVDLSAFANTDAQAISLVGDELRITGNASVVDLAAYANTDAQALSYDAATGVLTLANGGPAINLSASTIIDDQTLSLSGTELTIANGNMVDLAPIGVLSSGWSRSGTDVTLGGGATSVGIGTSPASGVALHVTGVARFDGLTGTGLGFVMADASGNLTRRVISSVTGWNYTGGTNMSLANASQNLMVGIGTATAKLHVDGSTLLDGSLEVSEAATFNNDVNIDLSTTGTKMTITGNGTDDPLQLINVQAAGSAPHNVLVLDASGNVQVVNGVTASDRRLKENIKPMKGTLEKLLGMESVTFNYRKDVKDYPYSLDEETHYGVIAQQVQAAFPHAVVEKDGYLHIQEKELMGVVISATKELSAKNAELEAANEHLAEQLHHMMMDKADLEKTVHSLEAQTSELQTSMDQVLQHIANGKQVQAGGN